MPAPIAMTGRVPSGTAGAKKPAAVNGGFAIKRSPADAPGAAYFCHVRFL